MKGTYELLPPRASICTPWGFADSRTTYADGVVFYSTPSHGGFFLSHGRNAQIPLEVRKATFNNGQGVAGWYEEDCDWSIVAKFFPECFEAEDLEIAARIYQSYVVPRVAEVLTGATP